MAAVVPLVLAASATFGFDASPALAGQTTAAALPTFAVGQGSASQYVGTIAGSFEEVGLYSEALGRNMTYYLYLPPGAATSGRRYPVLYMLHGGGGTKDEWPAYGIVNDVDQLIAAKQINPLIVVMPQGDRSYWVNWANGGPKWGYYVVQDVVRHVDVHYPTLADPRHRAIGGLSMGAAGALQLTFNHPDIFGAVGAHSPALHLDDKTFTQIYGTGSEFAQREPIDLAATAPNIGPPLKIWIDMGDADPWLDRDKMLHQNLLDRGIVHDWKLLTGGHNGEYWAANLPLYLHFYDSALNPSPST